MINSKITHPYTTIYQIDHIYNIFRASSFSLSLFLFIHIFIFGSEFRLTTVLMLMLCRITHHMWRSFMDREKKSTREKLHTKWIRQIECVRINKAVCKRQMWSLAAISQFLKAFSTSRQDFKFTTSNNLVVCRLHSIALARDLQCRNRKKSCYSCLYISIGIQ